MPVAVLRFKLPEERHEFEIAQKGIDFKLVLLELEEELRKKYKYQDQTLITIEEVRQMISDLCNERKIDIYD